MTNTEIIRKLEQLLRFKTVTFESKQAISEAINILKAKEKTGMFSEEMATQLFNRCAALTQFLMCGHCGMVDACNTYRSLLNREAEE